MINHSTPALQALICVMNYLKLCFLRVMDLLMYEEKGERKLKMLNLVELFKTNYTGLFQPN